MLYSEYEGENYILSEPRSGINLTLCSLMQIIRKPIGEIGKVHSVTNYRILIDFVSKSPFIYRTHDHAGLMKMLDKDADRVILLTRNPKELLIRYFGVEFEHIDSVRQHFLDDYIEKFYCFEDLTSKNRMLLFYEDVISDLDESLLKILDFIQEDPTYYNNYLEDKAKNIKRIKKSYQNQWKKGCKSSKDQPKAIFYTEGVDKTLLQRVDRYLEETAPEIYRKYLKRFET